MVVFNYASNGKLRCLFKGQPAHGFAFDIGDAVLYFLREMMSNHLFSIIDFFTSCRAVSECSAGSYANYIA